MKDNLLNVNKSDDMERNNCQQTAELQQKACVGKQVKVKEGPTL